MVKLRFIRLNPLTLEGGFKGLGGIIQLSNGNYNMFPVRAEFYNDETGEATPVEFINDFEVDNDRSTGE
jgi:hypothetical protein